MKTHIEEKVAKSEADYPCIKKWKNNRNIELVVMFTEPETGYVIHASQYSAVLDFNDKWAEKDFYPFHGTITIDM